MKILKNKTNLCRFCKKPLNTVFADLGVSPVSNAFLTRNDLTKPEVFHPLVVYICNNCLLVQIPEHEKAKNLFNNEYAYFSSYSDSWLLHCRKYSDYITQRLKLDKNNLVIELASNDGYLLQYFLEKGIKVLGVEPTTNTAKVAKKKSIPTITKFFGVKLSKELKKKNKLADLLIGNNVLAHVPNLNDFVAGMKIILKSNGVITMEFPHLVRLIEGRQFDTIYHEHFSYFTFSVVRKVFAKHGMKVFDVQEIKTHGGSLRVFASHKNSGYKLTKRAKALLSKEKRGGYNKMSTYLTFQNKINEAKRGILKYLVSEKSKGKQIVGYGAPAKGNTFLNYCGIRSDLLDYTVDRSPHKQGHFLPGTHIPIYSPDKIKKTKPDYVFILPWNIKDEIISQMREVRSWGGKFITAIPKVQIFS